MICRDRGACVALLALSASALPGCWPDPSSAPPPFDCASIDRAEERFPEECGDAGVIDDAEVPSDGGEDAAP